MKKIRKTMAVILVFAMLFACTGLSGSAVSGNIPDEVVAVSSELAVAIEQEGIVLLKNEDNSLPLADKKINVFGAASVVPLMGGAGSGAITTHDPVYFYEALDEAGIAYNTELMQLYDKNCGGQEIPRSSSTVLNNLVQLMFAKSSIQEMNPAKLTDAVMQNAKAFSDTAVIVIGRTSAENSDLSPETLRLSDNEKAMVERVTAAFSEVIVLFNIGNVMEMGFLDEYESIKAAAIVWITGEFGMRAVGQMLSGEINPSGRLADTVAYSVYDHPSTQNFGTYEYKGGEYYVEYQEGIYVGYRYFETFNKDAVQYPFGYGLSYTTFAKELLSYSTQDGKITVDVKVTNTGDVSGKDTVQIYYSAPYTGKIEKSAICLGGYEKSKLLAPGESDILTVEFDVSDMASYDKNENEAWVLEKGDYQIILGENVREHIDSFTYTLDEDIIIKNDNVTGTEIRNLFDHVYSGFPLLSRADKDGTYPAARELTKTDAIKHADDYPEPVKEGEAPKMGVCHESGVITLQDVYENEDLMEPFLDQLTLDEMTHLVTHSGYQTYGIERLGIPQTWDNDGPSSVKGAHGITYTDCGTAYPCATAIACTWNKDLAYAMGDSVGKEARSIGTDIWYAPGVNIHRNPMGGRNFEYFSEDPVLSGTMGAQIIDGAWNQGLVTTVKHFVMNDQEAHRAGIFTWADEQAMREIYLKAFEIPVKESACHGVMSAYNRLGTDWCGASSELLIDLLRNEWGYEGYVVSDYSNNFVGNGYMSPVLAVYNGNDTMLTGVWFLNMPSHLAAVKAQYMIDPVGFGTALRDCARNVVTVKMKTKAFLEPGYFEDDPDLTIPLSQWDYTERPVRSVIVCLLTNLVNIIVMLVRILIDWGF
ncbi:MAG: glycoside hydrolase family 3 protein [Clostridia bacterium]|nr:glycoside hydrolase family 3 protein [Clostridia bacterium]